jgi:hypothetical protein
MLCIAFPYFHGADRDTLGFAGDVRCAAEGPADSGTVDRGESHATLYRQR